MATTILMEPYTGQTPGNVHSNAEQYKYTVDAYILH